MFGGRKGGGFGAGGAANLNFLSKLVGGHKTAEQAEDTLEDLKFQYRNGNKDSVRMTRELMEELIRENNERLIEFDNERIIDIPDLRLSPSQKIIKVQNQIKNQLIGKLKETLGMAGMDRKQNQVEQRKYSSV